MGTRLSGPQIATREGEILTVGVVAGAVQIPSGGTPIVLLSEHQATGGYPVIATVISARSRSCGSAVAGRTSPLRSS